MPTITPAATTTVAASTDPAVVHAEIRSASSMTDAMDRFEQALNDGVSVAAMLELQAASMPSFLR
jgi:hypothetical protein